MKALELMAVPGKTVFWLEQFAPVSLYEIRPAEVHRGFCWNSDFAEQLYLLPIEHCWQHFLVQDHPAIVPLQ